MTVPSRIPPFQRFLDDHSPRVWRYLVGMVGPVDADDCFQETFLAALRAYDRLRAGSNERAWVLTIAQNVALDALRRSKPSAELVDTGVEDSRPAYENLADLTDGLPPKERAAVVLRYGYDLSYDQIAAAVGSSPDAARQAASTGVRRLRRSASS